METAEDRYQSDDDSVGTVLNMDDTSYHDEKNNIYLIILRNCHIGFYCITSN